ncbi:hypothetical protein JG687_00016634 [Phytophthora cactorum]|uniref:PLC-like phosphodiesterase, TIM beta/alpha-barrel domain n=1 Tax=Phytophthora cactorum TaxID=29920 RepID=A0A8T1TVG2_9STRA|nr:hypothetical protein PC120_g9414 [Phytophthora cactorum]KAG3069510.1 hypothetical protein PC121_g9782 [Phytophthora cactorum]KAG4061793.1 hypothetical protein PC123_g3354 [Phytophthora cactorum]KAG6946541.1 hypothetical protein JG687_00016634 [Phytophthora cactorum]
MAAERSRFAMLLLTTVAIMASISWAWDHRQLSSQEIHQRLLAGQVAVADNTATCDEMLDNSFFAGPLKTLPAFGGFQACINANIFDLYPAIERSEKCNLSVLLSLVSGDSGDSSAFMEVLKTLLGGVTSSNSSESTDLKTTLSSWSTNTTKLNGFCKVMNTKAGPCIETLLPALISLLESDAMCCHELNGYLEVLKLLVPTGQTLEQTVIDIVNGLHQTMCTTATSDGEVCAAPMLSYLSAIISTDESSLLGAIIFRAGVPLYVAAENDVCSSLETTSLASGLASGASIPYYAASCCASGLSKFLQSLDSVMTHLSGNSMAELFTLITGRQNAVSQFTALYPAIESCAFESTCTSPNFTLSVSNTSSNATTTWSSRDAVNSKTRSPKNVTCTLVKLCDSNSVCSEVCEAGTASIDPWVVDTIAYQNEMSYAETLCCTQLPATHNSVITQARGYGNRDQLFNAMLNASNPDSYTRTSNQFLSLTDQLNVGARFLELDVHYFASALRDAHCSNLGVSLIDTLSADMVISLKSVLEASGEGSTVEWSSDLVGCLPSLSGIRAEEQRLHNESLAEIATWLASHPNDFVVLFADIGDEVASFGQTDALLKLYANTFGDLLFSPSDFESTGGDWNRFTLEDLIQQGKHVVLVTASEANSVMFYSREMCAGWVDIPRNATGPTGTFFGETMNAGKIVRAFESELHYATFSEGSFGGGNKTADTSAQPANVNASSLPVFVEAGVNFVAPDGLDGETMASMVWSWAENEPDVTTTTAVELSGVDGCWHGVVDPSTISNVACVSNSSRMTWKVVAKGSNCPDGFVTGAPRLAVENAALLSVLRLEAGAATAQLDVELSSLSSGKMTTQLNVNAPALPPVV